MQQVKATLVSAGSRCPADSQPATGSRVSEASPAAAASVGQRLLVVDENTALLQTAQALFAGSNWNCLTCRDTLSALCTLVEQQPAAVLVDAEAAPLDGWKFCLLVKEHELYRHTRIIVLGRQDNVVLRAQAAAAGADAFLPKPFSAEEALALLDAPARRPA
jgi:DNA-binding response OmpR family regulator